MSAAQPPHHRPAADPHARDAFEPTAPAGGATPPELDPGPGAPWPLRAAAAPARWVEDRTGVWASVGPILTHLAPRNARWWYVLGSAALATFMLQVATGVALSLYYVPGAGDAYQTLRYLTEETALGNVLRSMHFYGASVMIALVVLHMTQVYLHAAYKFPREVNWISGVSLLFFTLGMGFTGQVLRWDGNAVWSVMVGVEQASRVPVLGELLAWLVLGGTHAGAATLSRMFVLHVFVLPGMIFAMVGLHLFLVLRNGVSEMPDADAPVDPETYRAGYRRRMDEDGVPFWPDVAWRDGLFTAGVFVLIVVLAVTLGPPALDAPPDPSNIDVNPAPDWYLRWYFALLALSPGHLETWIILGFPLVCALALLGLPLASNAGHRAPTKRPWSLAVIVLAAVLLGVLTVKGYTEPWSPRFDAGPLPPEVVASEEPEVLYGASLFASNGCVYCHRIGGHGGRRGPELTSVGTRLTADDVVVRINNGGTNMPAFADKLSAEELDALVAFLLTRRPAPPGTGGG